MRINFTKPLRFAAALIVFLLTLEIAIPLWRNHVPVSTAPVFSLPMAQEALQNPGAFQRSIDVYHADRGGELKLPGPDGSSLTIFYFEWDQVESGAIMDIDSHRPEECNVVAGFILKSQDPNRLFETPDHSSLEFDATTFADPSGRIVHVFKTAWIQGLGSWDIRVGENRKSRFFKSFRYGRGAARVLECGVTGAQDANQAWQIFHNQVLQRLAWTSGRVERPARP